MHKIEIFFSFRILQNSTNLKFLTKIQKIFSYDFKFCKEFKFLQGRKIIEFKFLHKKVPILRFACRCERLKRRGKPQKSSVVIKIQTKP